MSTKAKASKNCNTETRELTPQERLEAGYMASVGALTEDIVKEYGARLDNGTKLFRYLKTWDEEGYFMSAVYTQGDGMKPGINTILQTQYDINRFWDDVRTKLVVEYGIHSLEWTIKYHTNNNTWHFMKFDVTMSLDKNQTQTD